MRAGVCAGAVPADGCQYRGWSPNWLAPKAEWDAVVLRLLNDPDETVCPLCLIDRAVTARLPGFNNQKRNRLRNALNTFHCFAAGGSRATGHTHLFSFTDEAWSRARDGDPAEGERSLPGPIPAQIGR